MVKGWLKDALEEADKEKDLKQVAKVSLKEKASGLKAMEHRATTTEKVLEQAEQKANEALNKLGEAELKLAETASILSTLDKEFVDYKGGEKARKQTYYNKGFKHAMDSVGPVIFQAQKFGFMEGWIVAVNANWAPCKIPI